MKVSFSNPVLFKELKLRFRSPKSFLGILFYLIAMCIFVFGFIFTTTNVRGTVFFGPEQSFFLFGLLSYIQLALVLFITPGLTAGSISSEREKQTLPILLTTAQSSFQIISGKLLSSIAFLLLLIIAGLPIYSLVFLFGGISPKLIVTVLFFLLLTLIALGSVGVMFSTLIRRTIVSMIATYGVMLFLSVVTGFLFLISLQFSMIGRTGIGVTPSSIAGYTFASINPEVMLASILSPNMNEMVNQATNINFSIWIGYVIVYVLLTVICLWIAIKSLRVNMRKK